MIYGLGISFFTLLIYGPTLWVKFVMWRHSKDLIDMPGTGGELAQHLVQRYELEGVKVKSGAQGENYYSPDKKIVSLSSDLYTGKSLTAIAVAAHEVGHAIQFSRGEPISKLRSKYLGGAFTVKKFGAVILLITPVVFAVLKIPHVFLFSVGVGIATLIASALMYLAILPEEYDASFNKALPILSSGYVPDHHIPAIREVLRAAALTYFAGALADSIRLWQLFRYIR
jgi:Zn-dependent membrane protease YugP